MNITRFGGDEIFYSWTGPLVLKVLWTVQFWSYLEEMIHFYYQDVSLNIKSYEYPCSILLPQSHLFGN